MRFTDFDVINKFFIILEYLDDFLWSYIALLFILMVGSYLTIKSRFFQLRVLFRPKLFIKDLIACADKNKTGTHPIKLYFASIGGMIGLGNIVVVVATVTIGGPGSLIWLWIASIFGMLVKYSEIYLGIKYRLKNTENGYDGGPMYYLKAAFNNNILPIIVCILLCIYGAEVSQFLILTDTISNVFSIDKWIAIALLLGLVLLSAVGGVKRLANICVMLMPPFMFIYIAMGIWVIFDHITELPTVLNMIWCSAFSGKSQVCGLLASGMILSAHYGISRAVYSGDIGIGYDSIIQSETQTKFPEKQARMAVFALFTDSFICTITILILLVTGFWKVENLQFSEYVMTALQTYFSHINYFMATLFFIAGFTTIVGYLVVGQKCAKFLSPKFGKILYICYSIFAFVFFSFCDQNKVILVMSVSGGFLMIINLLGVFKLRKEIKFL